MGKMFETRRRGGMCILYYLLAYCHSRPSVVYEDAVGMFSVVNGDGRFWELFEVDGSHCCRGLVVEKVV